MKQIILDVSDNTSLHDFAMTCVNATPDYPGYYEESNINWGENLDQIHDVIGEISNLCMDTKIVFKGYRNFIEKFNKNYFNDGRCSPAEQIIFMFSRIPDIILEFK